MNFACILILHLFLEFNYCAPVFCEEFFHGPITCTNTSISSKKCIMADSRCWLSSVPRGYICNSSGVYVQQYSNDCKTLQYVLPNALNAIPGQCSSTTFGFGDSFYINTCKEIPSEKLILKSSYLTFPHIYPVPNCSQPGSLELVPQAIESGSCYTQSLTPPLAIIWTCRSGIVLEDYYRSISCNPVYKMSNMTKKYKSGECYSINQSPPYANGYQFQCSPQL